MKVQFKMTDLLANNAEEVPFNDFLDMFLTTVMPDDIDPDIYIISISKMHPLLQNKFRDYGLTENSAIELDYRDWKKRMKDMW